MVLTQRGDWERAQLTSFANKMIRPSLPYCKHCDDRHCNLQHLKRSSPASGLTCKFQDQQMHHLKHSKTSQCCTSPHLKHSDVVPSWCGSGHGPVVLWSHGPWSSDPVVLWSSGLVFLWSRVFWTCSPVAPIIRSSCICKSGIGMKQNISKIVRQQKKVKHQNMLKELRKSECKRPLPGPRYFRAFGPMVLWSMALLWSSGPLMPCFSGARVLNFAVREDCADHSFCLQMGGSAPWKPPNNYHVICCYVGVILSSFVHVIFLAFVVCGCYLFVISVSFLSFPKQG